MSFNGFKELTFENRNCIIHYWRKNGDNNKFIFLLHGAGCDHIMFEKQIEIFDNSYNIIAWDARGHGLSKLKASQKFSFKDMVDDCLKLYEICKTESAILIGQSMGGNLSQEIAYFYPERVLGIVIIDSANNTQSLTILEKAMLKLSRYIFNWYPWKTLIKQSAYACGNTKYTRNYVMKCFEKMEKENFIEIMTSLMLCLHEDNEYRFKRPVLLLCGVDDKSGNIKKTMLMLAKNDHNCKLYMIRDAGHNSNQDNAEEVNKYISIFLKNGMKI
jgi:pimeloyl-ACP methyl ester carboxylesterase